MQADSAANSSPNATLNATVGSIHIHAPEAESFICSDRLADAEGLGLIRLYHLSILLCTCVALTTLVAAFTEYTWLKGFRTYTSHVNAHLAAAVALGLLSDSYPMSKPTSCAVSLFSSCASTLWACFWMVHVYLSASGSQVGKKFRDLYFFLGWGVPLVALLPSLLVYGRNNDICWSEVDGDQLQHELSHRQRFGQSLAVALPLLVEGAAAMAMMVIFVLNVMRLCGIRQKKQPPVLKALKTVKTVHVLIFTVMMTLLNAPVNLMRFTGRDIYGACTARAAYGLVPITLFAGATDLLLKCVYPRPAAGDLAQPLLPQGVPPRSQTNLSFGSSHVVTMQLDVRGQGAQLPRSKVKKLRIWTATFNAGDKSVSNLDELLPPDVTQPGGPQTDLVVIATQECRKYKEFCGDKLGWHKEAAEKLGDAGFAVLATELMYKIGIFVAIRREFVPLVRGVKKCAVGTGLLGFFVNKGTAAVQLTLGQSVLIFASFHLNAFSEYMARRLEDVQSILAGMQKFTPTADVQSESHHFFILGDLNFRLSPEPLADKKEDLTSQEYHDFLNRTERLRREQRWQELAEHDQLRRTLDQHKLLLGFRENLVAFDPTFKLNKDGGYKDSRDKHGRVPSHTDRILTRSAHGHCQRLVQQDYTSGTQISNSDHRPVRGNFTLQVAEESDQGPSLKLCIEELTLESDKILVEPLCVQGKIIGTEEWEHTEAVWSGGKTASFRDALGFEVCRATAREKLVLLQVRRLACFGEEGDCLGVCAIPLQASDDEECAEGDRYTFSAKLLRASADVGVLHGKLTLADVMRDAGH